MHNDDNALVGTAAGKGAEQMHGCAKMINEITEEELMVIEALPTPGRPKERNFVVGFVQVLDTGWLEERLWRRRIRFFHFPPAGIRDASRSARIATMFRPAVHLSQEGAASRL